MSFRSMKDVEEVENACVYAWTRRRDSGPCMNSAKQRTYGFCVCGGDWTWKTFSNPLPKSGCQSALQVVSWTRFLLRWLPRYRKDGQWVPSLKCTSSCWWKSQNVMSILTKHLDPLLERNIQISDPFCTSRCSWSTSYEVRYCLKINFQNAAIIERSIVYAVYDCQRGEQSTDRLVF